MTREQAMAELGRLCEAMDRTLEALTPHQMREWNVALMEMSYERGRAAITHLIRTWTWSSFPPVGSLFKAARETTLEGQPNAGAYSQNGHSSSQDPERIAASIRAMERWVSMDDEEYFAEVLRMQAEGRVGIRGG